MANAMRGLRVKPSYEQLIGVAFSDELENIKLPNRDATFLRNGFALKSIRWRRHEGYAITTRASHEIIA